PIAAPTFRPGRKSIVSPVRPATRSWRRRWPRSPRGRGATGRPALSLFAAAAIGSAPAILARAAGLAAILFVLAGHHSSPLSRLRGAPDTGHEARALERNGYNRVSVVAGRPKVRRKTRLR